MSNNYGSSFGNWGNFWGGGSNSQSASSDVRACNMVASWASMFDGGSAGATAACNQQQASTVGNLATAPATGQLPGLGAPIGSNGDPITIGDVTDVPEPSSLLMVGGGLALAAIVRRRRQATA